MSTPAILVTLRGESDRRVATLTISNPENLNAPPFPVNLDFRPYADHETLARR